MGTNAEPRIFAIDGADGVRLRCMRWGDSPRVVVAVHGMNAHGMHWRRPAEQLLPDYSLIAYDLRGHGESGKPETGYSYEHYTEDLARVIAETTTEPPVLVGHSLGGRISIPYAAERPLRAYVVVDPGIVPLEDYGHASSRRRRDESEMRFVYESREAYIERMRHSTFLRKWSHYAEEYAAGCIEPTGEGETVRLCFRLQALREITASIRAVDLLAYIPRIACPTLVMRATEGHMRADVADRIVRDLPNGRLTLIEHANHNVMLDEPEQFDRALRSFLDEVYAGGGAK
ncbi:MAG: alpha/beta hydrolase [Dehalococcoidia bacterium]